MMTEFIKVYYWVVLCKNHLYHNRQNRFFGHKILLGETDDFASRPRIEARFKVKCDDCGNEYFYQPDEVLRYETEPRDPFDAHPLFSA